MGCRRSLVTEVVILAAVAIGAGGRSRHVAGQGGARAVIARTLVAAS